MHILLEKEIVKKICQKILNMSKTPCIIIIIIIIY